MNVAMESSGNSTSSPISIVSSDGNQGSVKGASDNVSVSQSGATSHENGSNIVEEKQETANRGERVKFLTDFHKKAKNLKNQVMNSSSDFFTHAKADLKSKGAQDMIQKVSKSFQKGFKESSRKDFITSRKLSSDDSNKFRRGPVGLDELVNSNTVRQRTTHGTIDSDDEDKRTCRPSSKGLLTYFKELGQSSTEGEKVDLAFVDSLFEAGADVNHEDRYGQTTLHAVARDWHTDVAKYFLGRGALIDKADKYGRTPLHLAAAVDHHVMVEFLVLNGANVDEITVDGQTPLHFASKASAINAIKTLIRLGARINARDKSLRTPLFIAAESGRAHAASVLLDNEAPAGVYDDKGTSAMTHMVEKMPNVAYAALAQFYVDDKALRRKYFYLNQLESEKNQKATNKNYAKTALEMIVVYKETKLVMHPVIQKLINVKWNLFARKRSWIDLIINLIFTFIWLVLAVLIPRDGKFHTPLSSNAWRIALEAIFLILSTYFAIQEFLTSRNMHRWDSRWINWMARSLENELENCHPKWPDERRYIESEIERLWKFKGTYSRNMPWSVYEWVCYISVLATAAAEVYYELHPTSAIAMKAFPIVISISVALICLRLMKICRAFTFLSAFIVLLGHVVGATLKFAFLFFEFFIPYVCILWVIYGGGENVAKIDKISPGSGIEFEGFGDIVYITWLMTVTADIPFSAMIRYERQLSMIIVGTYYALVSVVCINLYIALMSETFTRVYENAEANASLQQALLILYIEKRMSNEKTAEIRKYFRRNCSPLEQRDYEKSSIRSLNLENEAAVLLGNVDRQLSSLTANLDGSESKAKDMQSDDDNTQLICNDLKKKSRALRKDQTSFLRQMKDSLDDVTKTQENVTKILKAIVSRTPKAEKGQRKLRRAHSSQSIG